MKGPFPMSNFFIAGTLVYMGTIVLEGVSMSLTSKVCFQLVPPQILVLHGLLILPRLGLATLEACGSITASYLIRGRTQSETQPSGKGGGCQWRKVCVAMMGRRLHAVGAGG